jgi:branched-chain amino acid transport system substrate-binding protein
VHRALSRRSFLGAALAAGASACRRGDANEVVLGVLAARAGDRAVWGEDLHRGIELAVEQLNSRGGLLGRHVRLLSVDDASRDEQAGPLVTRVCEHENPIAVLGELSTSATERGARAAQRAAVPFVGTANTLRDISRIGDFVFRTALTDAEQASALARHARTVMQRRRAAVLYRRSSLVHLAMADGFAQTFRTAGGDVVVRDTFEGEDTELVHLAARIRTAGCDAVFVPADSGDAARVAVALRHGRVTSQILGTDGWTSPDLRRYAAENVNGVLYSDAFAPGEGRPEVDGFVQTFREKYHAMPGTFAALGFDAARWVLSVASRVPSLEARALRDALAGSRLEDAAAGAFEVDARRALTRSTHVMRIDPDRFTFVATATP